MFLFSITWGYMHIVLIQNIQVFKSSIKKACDWTWLHLHLKSSCFTFWMRLWCFIKIPTFNSLLLHGWHHWPLFESLCRVCVCECVSECVRVSRQASILLAVTLVVELILRTGDHWTYQRKPVACREATLHLSSDTQTHKKKNWIRGMLSCSCPAGPDQISCDTGFNSWI